MKLLERIMIAGAPCLSGRETAAGPALIYRKMLYKCWARPALTYRKMLYKYWAFPSRRMSWVDQLSSLHFITKKRLFGATHLVIGI